MISPISIDRALLDERLLGAALGNSASWSTWLVVLKAAFAMPRSGVEAIKAEHYRGLRLTHNDRSKSGFFWVAMADPPSPTGRAAWEFRRRNT